MKRLLVICPTRQRANRCSKMLNSFNQTSSQADILILLDWCDTQLKEYFALKQFHLVDKRMSNTDRINHAFRTFQNTYDFFSVTNDDFIYETQDWDQKLIYLAESGISYGDDGLQGKNMPTSSIISAKIVRSVGWLQQPNLRYLYGDAVWKAIGTHLGILRYDSAVKIRHNHYFGKNDIKKDDIYAITNSKETYKKDYESFKEWLKKDFNNDCQKIKEALNDISGRVEEKVL